MHALSQGRSFIRFAYQKLRPIGQGLLRAECYNVLLKGMAEKSAPFGSMPIFFSRHSAHPFELLLLLPRVVFLSPKVLLRFSVRSGETLLSRGSIFATVTAPFVS